ncbi:MAG TPA: carboxy-S-adenosyl-L-methionine synthase CmoA [Thermodesulfobacteriota bacterium]|nr:carboxy-S-adenosyl-L-methionine synthase CmoA [Thermodesulfobacteriota bacterium]
MSKDKIFRKKQPIVDFNFKKKTAQVFDDMLNRSVPFYQEIQRMTAEIAADFSVPGTNVYDLGCSTGSTLIALEKVLPPEVSFVGVDYSPDMLEKAREKLAQYKVTRPCEFICRDLDQGISIVNASVVVFTLTLQFVRPLRRRQLIQDIARGLNKGGCLILIEKVLCLDSKLNRLFIDYYYAFKRRQGYNQLEISQKREALENILIPYRPEENRQLLLENGFTECDMFFKWYNFCGMLAIK